MPSYQQVENPRFRQRRFTRPEIPPNTREVSTGVFHHPFRVISRPQFIACCAQAAGIIVPGFREIWFALTRGDTLDVHPGNRQHYGLHWMSSAAADYKPTEHAGRDEELLWPEPGELRDPGFDPDVIGFDRSGPDALFPDTDGLEEEDNTGGDGVPPFGTFLTSRRGDVRICGVYVFRWCPISCPFHGQG